MLIARLIEQSFSEPVTSNKSSGLSPKTRFKSHLITQQEKQNKIRYARVIEWKTYESFSLCDTS